MNKGLEADINSSVPDSDGTAWTVFINNKSSTANTVVAVAICAASSSLESYSVQSGTPVAVAAHDVAEAIVTCPTGTVALGGGATNDGRQTYQALIDSSPDGAQRVAGYPHVKWFRGHGRLRRGGMRHRAGRVHDGPQ